MEAEIVEAFQATVDTKAAYHAALPTANRAELERLAALHKVAQRDLSVAIRGPSKDCPGCGAAPHGMVQQIAVGKQRRHGFGIGCLVCKNRYAEGLTPDEARLLWNADEYHELGNK